MEDDKFKDLLEDEELTALRIAALASKKKTEQNKNEYTGAQHIGRIVSMPSASSELLSNQIPFVQSDRSAHNSYLWRKQNQSSRRRGGSFPKNHRSNLIVISPVTLNDEKSSGEKAPALILPQHKWCNLGNDDSMSPKTRRTGPTRFNRHGSDSESSDDESDYEPSDNDSGSNETILQDEPPEHFSCLSPDKLSDSVDKNRRLSFQSLDSDVKSDAFDKNEATSVYKSLKNSFYSDTKQDKYAVQQHLNDREQAFNNYDDNIYINSNVGHAYTSKSSDLSEDLVFKQSRSTIGKGESGRTDTVNSSLNKSSDPSKMWQENHNDYLGKRQSLQTFSDAHCSKNSVWQHSESYRNDNSLYHENQCMSANPRSYIDNSTKSHYLSDSDLRLELKKRMQEMKSKGTCSGNNEMIENKTYTQYDNSWDKNRSGYPQKGGEINLSSANSIGGTHESSFHQSNRIKQNFMRKNDDEHISNFNQQRSRRSISKERTTQESSSNRDKNRFDSSSDGRRRYSRSSSLDRNRDTRSSSQGRKRRERSSSHDEKRYERSSSQSRIKHNNNNDGRSESNLSPHRNKFENLHRLNKTDNGNNFAEGRRNWYKTSPKERSERSSSQDRNKHDRSSSSENRHGRSTSLERNNFQSGTKNNQQYVAGNDKEKHIQSHDRNRYEDNLSRGRSKHSPVSSHNRNRREHSSSRDRSRHESSRSLDSRSDRSCSPRKHRYNSSRERSKGERSSSDSESKYNCHSRDAFNASKQNKSKHDTVMNQNTSIKAKESSQDLVQECDNLQSKKLKSNLSFGKMKGEGSKKISTQKSIERSKLERSSSKEKIFSNTKPNKKNSMKQSYKNRYSRSRSSSSESCSSSYSSSSSRGGKPKIRSVPSVIKSVLIKSNNESSGKSCDSKSVGKSNISITSQTSVHSVCTKKNLNNAEINKPSNIKCGRIDGDSKASEGKRVPVHMRLGAFPRKRVIQMPKDVEAAFVNSSSSSDDENVNTKCKRQNIRIVTDMFNAKNRIDLIQQKYSSDNKPAKRSSPDTNEENFKRAKAHR